MATDTLAPFLLLFLVLGSFIARFLLLSSGMKLKKRIILIIIAVIILSLIPERKLLLSLYAMMSFVQLCLHTPHIPVSFLHSFFATGFAVIRF